MWDSKGSTRTNLSDLDMSDRGGILDDIVATARKAVQGQAELVQLTRGELVDNCLTLSATDLAKGFRGYLDLNPKDEALLNEVLLQLVGGPDREYAARTVHIAAVVEAAYPHEINSLSIRVASLATSELLRDPDRHMQLAQKIDRSIFPKEAAITELDLDLAGKVAKTLAGNETIKELIKSPFLTPDQLKLLASTVIEEAAAALGLTPPPLNFVSRSGVLGSANPVTGIRLTLNSPLRLGVGASEFVSTALHELRHMYQFTVANVGSYRKTADFRNSGPDRRRAFKNSLQTYDNESDGHYKHCYLERDARAFESTVMASLKKLLRFR